MECRRWTPTSSNERRIEVGVDAPAYNKRMTNLNVPGLDLPAYMRDLGERARAAARVLARADAKAKNAALDAIAATLIRDADKLLAANALDVTAARAAGNDAAFVDRLTLQASTIQAMAAGVRQVAALPDPVGAIGDLEYRPTGIQVGRMRVPLGVVGIVYESRPNVTVDAAALCLKSGNACILRGGSEAKYSNAAIASCITRALRSAELVEEAVQVLDTTDREAVTELVRLDDLIDVVVPRGGKG